MLMRDIAWRNRDDLFDLLMKPFVRFSFVKLPEFLAHFSDNILFFNYNNYVNNSLIMRENAQKYE